MQLKYIYEASLYVRHAHFFSVIPYENSKPHLLQELYCEFYKYRKG
jgi:hypothetical protein